MKSLFTGVFMIVLQLVYVSSGFCESWYARNLYEVSAQKGKKYKMVFITKVDDKNTCNIVLRAKGLDVGRWKNINNRCISGEDAEDSYGPIFENRQVNTTYISFIDNFGWPTRINFIEAPPEFVNPTAEGLADSLKEQGLEGVRVTYPKPVDQAADPD